MVNAFCKVVVVIAVLACSVFPQAKFGYKGAGAGFDVGLAVPSDGLYPTFTAGGLLDFAINLGNAGGLCIVPNIEFWVSGDHYAHYDLTVFESQFSGDVRYYFPLPLSVKVRPYVGNALGLNMDVWRHDWDTGEHFSDSDIHGAFMFLTGLDIPFSSKAMGFFQLKVKYSDGGLYDSGFDVFKAQYGMVFWF